MQRIRLDRRRIIYLIFFAVLLVVLVAIDQFSKHFFKQLYAEKGTTVVIDNFFFLTYTVNKGAAWSFLANKSWAQAFFKIITVFAFVLFVLFFYYALVKNYKWLQVAIVFSLGGTIGNFIDRLIFNGVTDFLSFQFGSYFFPVFNFADVCLTVGVFMIVFHMLFMDESAFFNFGKKNNEENSEQILLEKDLDKKSEGDDE